MRRRSILPAVVRARPERALQIGYRVLEESLPTRCREIVADAVRAAGIHDLYTADDRWELTVGWRTLVYGFIRRDVEERVTLGLRRLDPGWELRLECDPVETHAAHAAGVGGVLALAATVWLAAGWSAGLLPGLTTALAGGIWTDAARVMALGALERRLRSLVADVGSALWPSAPAEIQPPAPTFGPR